MTEHRSTVPKKSVEIMQEEVAVLKEHEICCQAGGWNFNFQNTRFAAEQPLWMELRCAGIDAS